MSVGAAYSPVAGAAYVPEHLVRVRVRARVRVRVRIRVRVRVRVRVWVKVRVWVRVGGRVS